MKIKFKKPIKYEILIEILEERNKNSFGQDQDSEKCYLTKSFINKLSSSIINFAINPIVNEKREETVRLIEEIHRYNLIKKQQMMQNKRLRLCANKAT